MSTPEQVQEEIAANNAAIDSVTVRLKRVTLELAAATRAEYPEQSDIKELRAQVANVRQMLDSLNRAKQPLSNKLLAAQNKVKTDRTRARTDYAAERLPDAETMLHKMAIEYLALCELSGRKQNGINLQNVKYGGRLAEMEAEL